MLSRHINNGRYANGISHTIEEGHTGSAGVNGAFENCLYYTGLKALAIRLSYFHLGDNLRGKSNLYFTTEY